MIMCVLCIVKLVLKKYGISDNVRKLCVIGLLKGFVFVCLGLM